MDYLGDFVLDATVDVFFTTHDKNGGAIAPSTAFEAADIIIYKGNSATQKATTNGITMTSPFDAVTGFHLVSIDTSNDTGDAGFWVTGADYTVVLSPDETVDAETVIRVLAQFSTENRSALRPTTAGQTLDIAATGEAGIDLDNTVGTLSAAQFAAAFITASKFAAGAIDAAAASADFGDELADALLERTLASHSTADTVGLVLNDWQNGGRLDLILDDILVDTAVIGALGAGLSNIPWNSAWDAEVESEVNDALDTSIAELGVGVPAATPTIRTGLMFLYMGARNKRDTTATSDEIHNDAGTVIASAVLSDDTVTYIKEEYA